MNEIKKTLVHEAREAVLFFKITITLLVISFALSLFFWSELWLCINIFGLIMEGVIAVLEIPNIIEFG